jgi:phosphinothricin acetyltransferase
MEALIDRARADGKHAMVGGVDGANERSIRFHEHIGFREVGRLPEIGWKLGRRLDLVLMQRLLHQG